MEDFGRREPQLLDAPDALLALIDAEVAARQAAGENPHVGEYVHRFPHLEDHLRRHWQATRETPMVVAERDPFGTVDRITPLADETPAIESTPAKTDPLETRDPDTPAFVAGETPVVENTPVPQTDPDETRDPHAPESAADPLRTTDDVTPKAAEESLPSTKQVGCPPQLAPLGLPNIGGYAILGELGKGGMGVVYKAEQAGLKRIVALKMILSGRGAGPEDLVRFRLEAEAIARIKHPNIVQVYEIGEHDGRPFFSLEYIEGGSLAGRLRESLLAPHDAARLCQLLAGAIHAAHQCGIIHRDLKPANVLLANDGTPKVTDFGLAKELDGASDHTHSGAVMGTPTYMAPEQAEGRTQEIGPAADVYALGGILYEMLAGRPAFKGATLLDVLNQVKHANPVPPSRLQARVPRDLETICLKCLQKDIRKRYASAGDLADDLARYLGGEPIRARRTPLWERSAMWVRRYPSRAAAVAAVLLALVVGAAFLGQNLVRRVHLARVRLDTQDLLLQAREEQKINQLDAARTNFRLALGNINNEATLADLKPGAEAGLNEVEIALDEQAVARAQQDQYREFVRNRRNVLNNEAMSTLLEGQKEDEEARIRKLRSAARDALAVYGVTLNSHGAPAVAALALNPSQKSDIVPGCYELLLALAEATALPLTGEDPREQAEQALRFLDRAAEFPIRSQAIHIHRATYLRQASRPDEALAEMQKANDHPPISATDLFLAGLQRYREHLKNRLAADPNDKTGPLPQAVALLEQSLRRNPDSFPAHFALAVCYLQQRRWDPANASLTQCIRLQERDGAKDFLWPYLFRAYANAEVRDFAAAEADFAHAERMNPDELVRYAILVNRGTARYLKGEFDPAAEDLRQAARLRPDMYQAHASLGELFLRQGKLAEAQEHLDRAIELKPLAGHYRSRARLHLLREEYAEALPDLREAIAREVKGRSVKLAQDHVECGRILYRGKKFPDALLAFQAALEAHPDPDSFSMAHRLQAEALIELNRFEDAIAALNLYLKKGPPLADVFRARGLAQAKLRKYNKAVEDYTQALDIDTRESRPPAPKTLAYRGWAYLLCDAPKLALDDFETVLKTTPRDADALTGRGNARVRLGDTKRALLDAEAALREGESSDRLHFNAARIYALAAERTSLEIRVQKDPADRTATQQRRRYETRAIRLLENALNLVPEPEREAFWRLYVETDPALKAIRKSAGYERLSQMYVRVGK